MISFTSGLAFRIVFASSNAFFWRSSQGRRAAILMSGYFSARRASMCFCHSIMLAAVSEAVMMANSPLPPSTRAALSIRVWPIPSGVAWLTKKSRASGSASASQVTTLIPLARALRSTEEIPSRFSTATAMTSTPRVIQVSIDLVLLGRVGVGRAVPDQLDAQLLRRLLGPLAAGDEVGVALALGHHRDGERPARESGAAVGGTGAVRGAGAGPARASS